MAELIKPETDCGFLVIPAFIQLGPGECGGVSEGVDPIQMDPGTNNNNFWGRIS